MMYHNGAGERKAFEGVRNRAFSPEGLPPGSSSLCPRLEPLLRRLRNEGANPAPRSVPFAGLLMARVSAFADDVSLCILPPGYKSCKEGLMLGGVAIPFQGHFAGVTDSSELQLERNWSEVQAKVDAQVGTCVILVFAA